MKQIRYGMFETNSSSTHCVILADKNCDAGEFVDFAIGEFGWERNVLKTPDEKASYLYTMACEIMGEDVYQRFYETLIKYGVNVTCSVPAKFAKDHGCWLDNGFVDHASDGDALSFVNRMLNHEHALIRYLFSPESFVVTWNDNMDEDTYNHCESMCDVDYPHEKFYKGN